MSLFIIKTMSVPEQNLMEMEFAEKEKVQFFSDLYDSHKGAVYGLVLSIVGNGHDAEDIVHSLFEKVWKDARGWNHVKSWRPNHIRHQIRLKKREETASNEHFLQPSEALDSEYLERIHLVLRKMDEPSRTLILLKNFQEMTFEQMGEVLEVPTSTASTRYYEAMDEMRTQWKEFER
jgi:RNA polymerase sigma factor (sigma-70 family)